MTDSSNLSRVRALAFDVFGTVVDWRDSIIREGIEWGKTRGLGTDWGDFADRWRAGYLPAMDKVRKGVLPWMKLDGLHRLILDKLLQEFEITGLSEEDKDHWNRVWHRLTPWPDVIPGLAQLKTRYILSTLSNGNVSLLIDMAKLRNLPWDVVLSAELFHHFKPDREVYLGALDLMGCAAHEVMMVAAHPGDLQAAQSCGMRSAFVHRPMEYGPPGKVQSVTDTAFDLLVNDFQDLAHQLCRDPD
jgi:2-haloacid dehalogenase